MTAYAIITEAPGCYGDTAHVLRRVEPGQRYSLTARQALHVMDGDCTISGEDSTYAAGDRLPGWRGEPDVRGPVRGWTFTGRDGSGR